MTIIEDGRGSGMSAEVCGEHRLRTSSVSVTPEHYVNHSHQDAYNMLYRETPNVANACFAYIQNTSDTDMVIEGFICRVNGTIGNLEIIEVYLNDNGTPITYSNNTPSSLYATSRKSAQGVFLTGANVTGLTSGDIIERYYLTASNTSTNINFNQDVIIPKGGVISFRAANSGAQVSGTINFNYHNEF